MIDASNARDLRQVGYYDVTGTDAATNPRSLSWDTAWHGDLVYLFDMDRGIEILRLKGGPHGSPRLATVREPRAPPRPPRSSARARSDARRVHLPIVPSAQLVASVAAAGAALTLARRRTLVAG